MRYLAVRYLQQFPLSGVVNTRQTMNDKYGEYIIFNDLLSLDYALFGIYYISTIYNH